MAESSTGASLTLTARLQLPSDVRYEIYSYFERYRIGCCSEHDLYAYFGKTACYSHQSSSWRDNSLLMTRRSLLLVSRQVHAEWAPIFYRSTFVVVNDGIPLDCTDASRHHAYRRNSCDFDNLFLKTLRKPTMESIKRIMYDATKFSEGGRKYVDFAGMAGLASVFRTYEVSLTSLREVVLCGDVWVTSSSDDGNNVSRSEWRSVENVLLESLRSLIVGSDWRADKLIQERGSRFYLIFRNLGKKPRTVKEWFHRWNVLGGKSPKLKKIRWNEEAERLICQTCIDTGKPKLTSKDNAKS